MEVAWLRSVALGRRSAPIVPHCDRIVASTSEEALAHDHHANPILTSFFDHTQHGPGRSPTGVTANHISPRRIDPIGPVLRRGPTLSLNQ